MIVGMTSLPYFVCRFRHPDTSKLRSKLATLDIHDNLSHLLLSWNRFLGNSRGERKWSCHRKFGQSGWCIYHLWQDVWGCNSFTENFQHHQKNLQYYNNQQFEEELRTSEVKISKCFNHSRFGKELEKEDKEFQCRWKKISRNITLNPKYQRFFVNIPTTRAAINLPKNNSCPHLHCHKRKMYLSTLSKLCSCRPGINLLPCNVHTHTQTHMLAVALSDVHYMAYLHVYM